MRKINIVIIAIGEIVKIFDTAMGVIVGGLTTAYITKAGDFATVVGTDMMTTLGVITVFYIALRVIYGVLVKIVANEEAVKTKNKKGAVKTVNKRYGKRLPRFIRRRNSRINK